MWTRYKKGADKERKKVREARDRGCVAFRSAGSHSPIDVCIIDKDNKTITFLQCKSKSESNASVERIKESLAWLNGEFKVEFRVELA